MTAVKANLKQLFLVLLSDTCASKGLDPNIRPVGPTLQPLTTLHLLTIKNDF